MVRRGFWAAMRDGIFRSFWMVHWMVHSETVRSSGTLLCRLAAVISGNLTACLFSIFFITFFIVLGLPETILRCGMTNFRRLFDFAQRPSMDTLWRPSRLAISAVDIPSSFQEKIRTLSSFFSFPAGRGTMERLQNQSRQGGPDKRRKTPHFHSQFSGTWSDFWGFL